MTDFHLFKRGGGECGIEDGGGGRGIGVYVVVVFVVVALESVSLCAWQVLITKYIKTASSSSFSSSFPPFSFTRTAASVVCVCDCVHACLCVIIAHYWCVCLSSSIVALRIEHVISTEEASLSSNGRACQPRCQPRNTNRDIQKYRQTDVFFGEFLACLMCSSVHLTKALRINQFWLRVKPSHF